MDIKLTDALKAARLYIEGEVLPTKVQVLDIIRHALEAAAGAPDPHSAVLPTVPHGYWRDGEWYGFSPGENPDCPEGETFELTPVWTHGQDVTFRCVAIPDSDDFDYVPHTPEDAALLERFADLGSTVSGVAEPAPEYEVDPMEVVRTLACVANDLATMSAEKREHSPSPLSLTSPLMIAARNACLERGFTAGGLSIEAGADGRPA